MIVVARVVDEAVLSGERAKMLAIDAGFPGPPMHGHPNAAAGGIAIPMVALPVAAVANV